jgi:hypothetical protein
MPTGNLFSCSQNPISTSISSIYTLSFLKRCVEVFSSPRNNRNSSSNLANRKSAYHNRQTFHISSGFLPCSNTSFFELITSSLLFAVDNWGRTYPCNICRRRRIDEWFQQWDTGCLTVSWRFENFFANYTHKLPKTHKLSQTIPNCHQLSQAVATCRKLSQTHKPTQTYKLTSHAIHASQFKTTNKITVEEGLLTEENLRSLY